MIPRAAVTLALAASLLVPTAVAHVIILPGPGDSASDPTDLVSAPARAFDHLASPGGFHYYAITLRAGESERVRLFAQPDAYPENTFASEYRPSVVVGASGWPNLGPQHQFVTFPAGYGAQSHESFQNESFADDRFPFRGLLRVSFELDANATGRYFLVVYSGEFGGNYALWVEPASGSPLQDRMEVPLERPAAWAWGGVSPQTPIVAGVVAVLLGAVPLVSRRSLIWGSVPRSLAAGAALVFAASFGARVVANLRLASSIGAWLATSPELIACALATWLAISRRGSRSTRPPIALVLALATTVAYAGWLLAPGLLIAAGLAFLVRPR
jgi:hypothetical protein